MMNIPPSEAGRLSLHAYEGMLHHWNAAHATGDDIKAPDAAKAQAMMDRINADPRFTGAAP